MKQLPDCITILILSTGLLCCFTGVSAIAPPSDSVEGVWNGALKISAIELRLSFKINRTPEGELTGTMDSIDQGATDIPVSKVSVTDDLIRFDVEKIKGFFQGSFTEGGAFIVGTWHQSGQSFPLKLIRSVKPEELYRPQEPVGPLPYLSEEITFPNEKADIVLAGTLTVPKGDGPFTAVILVSGSGPQNRDETVMGHRPFLILSDHLTRHGIAVLRFDDRGVGESTGKFTSSTSEDTAGDVMAGLRFLKSRKEINPSLIGIIGHSEGGIIAPMVAVQSDDVAFIVLLAGTGMSGDRIIKAQTELIAKAEGMDDDIIKRQLGIQEKMFTVIYSDKDVSEMKKDIESLLMEFMETLSQEEKEALMLSKESIIAEAKTVTSPWFRFFLKYDPKTVLNKVKCPVLAIIGELDLQVPADANLKAIDDALKSGGNTRTTVKKLPGLNHLFQTAKTGSPGEYAKISETMAPLALNTISDWIAATVK